MYSLDVNAAAFLLSFFEEVLVSSILIYIFT